MATVYHSIVQGFPKGISMAFAYGSGVMKQAGYTAGSAKMMDFTLVVPEPLEWHRRNLALHPGHYSALRHLGAQAVLEVQRLGAARVYYNTLVPTHAGLIKYGVISREDLIADLQDWQALYVAGRLHKPVVQLCAPDPALEAAQRRNLASAARAALLLLPERFSEHQLYEAITGLSYAGDVRMQLAEDRHKVRNIVAGQLEHFRALYAPALRSLEKQAVVQGGRGAQDASVAARHRLLQALPLRLQTALVAAYRRDSRQRDVEDVLLAAAQEPDCAGVVAEGIRGIVRGPSAAQALKGVATAGLLKAARYTGAKVWKRFTQ